MVELYLWTEHVTFSLNAYPGDTNPTSKTATIIKYKTNNQNLAAVSFTITPGSGSFPDVTNNCNSQTFQGSQFLHFGGNSAPTGVPTTADIYGTAGNLWGLCSGNSGSNSITLAGTTGLLSVTNGTNVLAYLYDDHFTIDSISSASNSSAQSYSVQGWSMEIGDPDAGATAIEFSSSATFSVEENQTSVGTVQASGGDGTALSFSITGGADRAKFGINSSSGVLTFNSAPDYETPDSAASSNAYAIIVTATDGTTPVTQSITVNVTNVNDPTTGIPGITSSGNTASPLVGDTLTATQGNIVDQDGLGAFSYEWKNSSGATVLGTSSTYTIQQNDKDYTITVSVSFTDGGSNAVEPLTSNPTGIVTAPNSPATGLPTITGTASEGGTLTANLDNIVDADGLPGSYTYQWKRGGSAISEATNSTYTVASADVGKTITVTVSFTDNAGNAESLTSAGRDIAALDDKIYFWTEYFADASYNIPADSTVIHYAIYNTTKISGVQFTYNVVGTTEVADVSYSIVDNSNNNTAVYKKEWLQIINNTTSEAYKSMLFWGNVNQTLNGMVTGTFAIIGGNISLDSVLGITNHLSENIDPSTDNVVLAEPQNPPTIENPGGRILGDLNFDASLNNTDADIMSAYLLNDTDISFNTYDSNGAEITPKKTAQEIIDEMMGGEWLEHVDINANGHVDVGDLVRILSKIADPTFNMSSGL